MITWARIAGAGLVAWIAAARPADAGTQVPGEDGGSPRSFALPMARDARTLAEEAEEHIAGERWSAALVSLQELIELHGGEVLPSTWSPSAVPGSASAHPGAAEWAQRRLADLSDEARALYRERYEARARAALENARAAGDLRGLAAVASRWPLTEAAREAWWTLGDLELERGDREQAALAWERAPAGDPAAQETSARRAAALAAAPPSDGAVGAGEARSERSRTRVHTPGGGALGGPVPVGGGDGWRRQRLDLMPFDRANGLYTFNVLPVLVEDAVLVATTMRVYAFDAFSGDTLWEHGPHPGWYRIEPTERESLFRGLDRERQTATAAAANGIVVTAMQIPYSADQNQSWQGISIMNAIPERRLIALDLATGDVLWDHAPPLRWNPDAHREGAFTWDDHAGGFAERMLVAAPPVVAGSRVLVPCYRMEGRIDYHVACYELATGELLWSTGLVSGQRERNMFGRAEEEFVASPVAVSGPTVVAQTELGTVAALDLVTGRILWEAEYEFLPQRKTNNYSAPQREQHWRETAPLVVDGLVICTPSDSDEIVAFELRGGSTVWSQKVFSLDKRVAGRRLQHDCMIGAEGDTIYLAGDLISALQKPGGLRKRGAFVERWSYEIEDRKRGSHGPRPILTRDEVVVPTRDERVVLDRRTGEVRERQTAPWSSPDLGAAVAGEGTLYTVGKDQVAAFFDWDTVLARQRERLSADPDDPTIAVRTAGLFAQRARTLHAAGETSRALEHLGQAKAILQPLVADGDEGLAESGAPGASWAPGAAGELLGVLRIEARLRADLADSRGALAALDEAKRLATGPGELRDVLFQEEALLSHRQSEAWRAVLASLDEHCRDLPLPAEVLRREPDWLIGEALYDRSAFDGLAATDLPVGLWVLLSRAVASARERDTAAALGDLHAALARYGSLPIVEGVDVDTLVAARIGRRLELDGRADYAPFERAAEQLVQRALSTRDPSALEQIGRLYPHSEAARTAMRTLLDWAFDDTDATRAAEIVYADAQRGGPDPEALVRLGQALSAQGNPEFLTELLRSLARSRPSLPSPLAEHGGRTLGEIAHQLPLPPPAARPQAFFGSSLGRTVTIEGDFEFAGPVPRLGPPDEDVESALHVYLAPETRSIHAFSSVDPTAPVWVVRDLPFPPNADTCALTPTRVIVGGRVGDQNALLAYDLAGQPAWTRGLGDLRVCQVAAAAGVCLVSAGVSGRAEVASAFDAHGGIPLWQVPLRGDSWTWTPPIFGEGHAVLFAHRWGHPGIALLLDLFGGAVEREIGLDPTLRRTHQSAWVQDGKLLVPRFAMNRDGPSGVTAFDLATGTPAWTLPLSSDEELSGLAAHEGTTYLVTYALSPQGPGRSGVHELNVEHGSIRTVLDLRADEEVIGLPENRRVELDSPLIFVHPRSLDRRAGVIQAIQLPYEKRWSYRLPEADGALYDGSIMPMPAVSARSVAFAYVTRDPDSRIASQTKLVIVDRETGRELSKRVLDPELGGAHTSDCELRGLGPALFVQWLGKRSRLEILGDQR